MTNEVKFQWGRDFEFQSSQAPLPGEPVSPADERRPWTSRAPAALSFGKPNFLERRSYPDERRIDIGDVFTLASGSHLVKIGADISRSPTPWTTCSRKAACTPTAAASTSSATTRPTSRTRARRRASTRPSARASGRPRSPSPRSISTRSSRTRGTSNQRTTLNLGLRYDYEQMPDPQIPNPAAARHVGVPEGPEQLRPAPRRRLRRERERQHGRPRRIRHVLRPHHQLDDLERHHQRRVIGGPAGTDAAEHVGRRADVPEHPRERVGDPGPAGCGGLRARRAEPARS